MRARARFAKTQLARRPRGQDSLRSVLIANLILFLIFFFLTSENENLRIIALISLLVFCAFAIFSGLNMRGDTQVALVVSLLVWEVAVPPVALVSFPALPAVFIIPFVAFMAAALLFLKGRRIKKVSSYAAILFISSFVSLMHYIYYPSTGQLAYTSQLIAAGMLSLSLLNGSSDPAGSWVRTALEAISIAGAFLAALCIYYGLNKGIISFEIFNSPLERLGVIGSLGGNYLGYVVGLGALSSFCLLGGNIDIFSRVIILTSMAICLFAVVATKSLSSIFPLIGLLLIRFSGDGAHTSSHRMTFQAARVIIVMIAIMAVGGADLASRQYSAFDTGRDLTTLSGRTDVWAAAAGSIGESPALGLPKEKLSSFMPAAVYKDGEKHIETVLTPHNLFLAHALYNGLPLAIALLCIMAFATAFSWRGLSLWPQRSPAPIWMLVTFMMVVHCTLDAGCLLSYLPVMFALQSANNGRAVATIVGSKGRLG